MSFHLVLQEALRDLELSLLRKEGRVCRALSGDAGAGKQCPRRGQARAEQGLGVWHRRSRRLGVSVACGAGLPWSLQAAACALGPAAITLRVHCWLVGSRRSWAPQQLGHPGRDMPLTVF